MQRLRNLPITSILLATWLFITLSYSIVLGCPCCEHNKHQSKCEGKHHKGHASLTTMVPLGGGCDCECVLCNNTDIDDTLIKKKYVIALERLQSVALPEKDSEEIENCLPELKTLNYLQDTTSLKFLSLFLLKSSFLL